MNMLEEKVLGIIEKNSRVSTREMAVVLGTEEIDVINALQRMDNAIAGRVILLNSLEL